MRTAPRLLLVGALATSLVASTASATLPIPAGAIIVEDGNSITQGVGQGAWSDANYRPTIDAAFQKSGTALTTSLATTTTKLGTVSTSPRLAPQDFRPTWINAGVSGDTVGMMLARVNTDVIARHPTVVIIEGGINDAKNSTNLGTFATQVASLISTIQTGLPGVPIMWIGLFCFGETYPSAGIDTLVPAYEAVIVAACASAGVTHVDVRTPQQAYEAAHNAPPTSVDTGVLCFDASPPGVHPSAALGQPIFGTAALAQTTLVNLPQATFAGTFAPSGFAAANDNGDACNDLGAWKRAACQ